MALLTLDAHWTAFYDQKPTFYWILQEHQQEICTPPGKRGWKAASTRAYYSRLYNELILPRVDDRALADYSLLDLQDIVLDICDTRTANGIECPEETINDIWRAIRRVCQTAAQHDVCDDVCWAPTTQADEEPVYIRQEKARTRIPRHLSPEQEHAIADALLSYPLQDGRRNGLMLMYVFGLRNSEACGITFGSIVTMDGHPYLATHKTTDTSHLWCEKGKTYNMYRLLWIPPRIYDFVMNLKNHIQALIENGDITIPPNSAIKSIDDFPIARNKNNWLEPCISSQLTSAGRQLFSETKYSEDAYSSALLEVLQMDEDEKLLYGDAKDPTAYIFRRNFASHLRDCGASAEQLQYAMGHQIVDDAFSRVDFVNPDMLQKLARIMSNRPIINNTSPSLCITAQDGIVVNDISQARITIPLSGSRYRLRILGYESHQALKIDASLPDGVPEALIRYHQQPRLESVQGHNTAVYNVNVLYDYHQLYQRTKP